MMDYAEYEKSIAPIIWRIRWQILAVQMSEYKQAKSQQERDQWKQMMLEKLVQINQLAQQFNPQSIPQNSIPPVEYLAQSATGNWCLRLEREMKCLFILAPRAGTSKISRWM